MIQFGRLGLSATHLQSSGGTSAGKAETHVQTARVRAIVGLMAHFRPESGRFRRCDPADGSLACSESCRKTRAGLLAGRRPGKSPPDCVGRAVCLKGSFFRTRAMRVDEADPKGSVDDGLLASFFYGVHCSARSLNQSRSSDRAFNSISTVCPSSTSTHTAIGSSRSSLAHRP